SNDKTTESVSTDRRRVRSRSCVQTSDASGGRDRARAKKRWHSRLERVGIDQARQRSSCTFPRRWAGLAGANQRCAAPGNGLVIRRALKVALKPQLSSRYAGFENCGANGRLSANSRRAFQSRRRPTPRFRPIGRYGIKKRRKAAFRQAISESRPARKCGLLNTILFERRAVRTPSTPGTHENVSQNSLLFPVSQKLIIQTGCER